MSRGMTRANRLKEIERLYLERAFSDIEMAQRMGVDRTISYRNRRELAADGEEEDYIWHFGPNAVTLAGLHAAAPASPFWLSLTALFAARKLRGAPARPPLAGIMRGRGPIHAHNAQTHQHAILLSRSPFLTEENHAH